MADGNLLSKLVLSAITVLLSLLFSCANVLGFLVKKIIDVKQMTIICYHLKRALMTLNEKNLTSQNSSVICPLPRENITNYIKC